MWNTAVSASNIFSFHLDRFLFVFFQPLDSQLGDCVDGFVRTFPTVFLDYSFVKADELTAFTAPQFFWN